MAASRKLDGNGISGKKLKAEMEILQCFLVVLLSAIVLATLAHAQDQTGTNKWSTVQLEDAIRSFSTEIIHVTARSYVFVCLVNTDSGTPFISALELRPLHNATYNTETGSLVLARRLDIGSTTNATVRHEGSASQYYTYMHFAEIAILQANQSREFDVYLNGQKWYGPIFPRYLSTNTIFTRSALNGGKFQFSLNKTGNATLPPLINAIEIYTVLELLQPQSDQEDVDAIMNIKSAYRIERNWQGDPCSPPDYLWEGLNCSYNDDDLPRIISLNLSSSGLTGRLIVTYPISHCYNLFSLAGKEDAKTNIVCMALEPKNREFTYSEILNITNNFGRVLGKGGFGAVYHGYLDDTEVAVKMLSPLSGQGSKQFQAEVKLLLTVHHRNLTTLVGFCSEEMSTNVLSWERRLQIAVDAAKGLEYLHNGCKPPIVHRDVKTANILLNDKFQAKLADFGLSRPFLFDGGTHISTDVVGTPGYLDPEYSVTYRLTEKSDVYSFGIVLLRISQANLCLQEPTQ
ncbi:hypothetical protein GH714_019931 [Hevea brasiliensis]|uniref:Protein kinase domain-containing protein n=1 Tax=Hevea brasiliensis TaxID=3981 RepID=A0A6A6LLZ3_HEVBR|nr:hypothetical protein GH714_019931 [Hevea brasiliensis]